MNPIAHLRETVEQEVFDFQVLADALRQYRKPHDRIRRMVDDGEIVRVKKGLYVFGAPFRRQPIVREYLANLIYGPSYVSLESAMSYHGLIPERVEAVTSVTLGRSHTFETPFGAFTYLGLPRNRYIVGAGIATTGSVRFIIASPEKALADKVWSDKRLSGTTVGEFGDYLFDDLRIDETMLRNFNSDRLEEISRAYGSTKIANLMRFVTKIKRCAYE